MMKKMKKVKFLSSLNAKLALAAVLVAGFTFTSCEEEDLTVSTPTSSSSSPNVTIDVTTTSSSGETSSTVDLADGVAYVALYAQDTSGQDLADVTFTVNDEEVSADTLQTYYAAATLEITATKDGYIPSYKTVVVPAPSEGQVIYITATLTLLSYDEDTTTTVEEEDITAEDVASATEEEEVTIFEDDVTVGVTTTYTIPVPQTYVGFLTEEQIEALYTAIEELSGSVSATAKGGVVALAATNLQKAKDLLKAKVDAYATHPGWTTVTQDITVTVTDGADTATLKIVYTSYYVTRSITISTVVENETYQVTGEDTVYTSNVINYYVNGELATHDSSTSHDSTSHDSSSHDHGDSSTAGGGTTGM